MSVAERRFISEVSALIDTVVTVITTDDKTYTGTLVGVNPENLNVIISDAKDSNSNFFPKVVINGSTIARILSTQKAFDLRGLAERLERVFPRMVKLYEKEGFIWVMDRVKVTEKGVVEGSGPAAERVQRIYTQFLREMQEKQQTQ
ncbi:Lsm family RNA-binding protein [Candidatus Bathyarchaeota archaeon]|nr:Lsm family RNA-binding protein [Candidatus Bathyarchaeota archaeon]RLG94257.1 MAG: hypothetical protein DRO37_06120 [Candidatus Bathyarchaeota archaeon]HDM89148.1 hypothetical protein [Candidatus Bathyarchaeota archaeon]